MKNYKVTVNGVTYDVSVEGDGSAPTVTKQAPAAPTETKEEPKATAPAPAGPQGSTKIESPMPGTVLRIDKKPGDAVKAGDIILILEAMKMENEITAPSDGTIASIDVAVGASVNAGDILATL